MKDMCYDLAELTIRSENFREGGSYCICNDRNVSILASFIKRSVAQVAHDAIIGSPMMSKYHHWSSMCSSTYLSFPISNWNYLNYLRISGEMYM